MGRRLTDAEASAVMRAAGLEPLDPYPGAAIPWRCRCNACGNEVTPNLNNVKRRGRSCGYCSGRARPDGDQEALLRARGLEPLVPYPGAAVPWLCRCSRCGHEVSPKLTHIRAGASGGCKYCAGSAIHPDDAVELLATLSLEPLEPYPGAVPKWRVRCLVCGTEDAVKLTVLRSGQRVPCQECVRLARAARPKSDTPPRRTPPKRPGPKGLTNEEAERFMRSRGFEPLDEYRGVSEAWRCRCTTCGNEVSPTLGSVRKGHGCRACDGQVVTADEAVASMRAAGLEPLEPFTKSSAAWLCRCTACGRESRPRMNSVRNKGSGCRYCAHTYRDPEEAVAIMREAGLEPLVPYPGANNRWPCRCLRCGGEPTPTFSAVRAGASCRLCAETGFRAGKPSLVYVVEHPELRAVKVGISNKSARRKKDLRLERHRRAGWTTYATLEVVGHEAQRIERAVLSWVRDDLGFPPFLRDGDGWTETVDAAALSASELWARVLFEAGR